MGTSHTFRDQDQMIVFHDICLYSGKKRGVFDLIYVIFTTVGVSGTRRVALNIHASDFYSDHVKDSDPTGLVEYLLYALLFILF